ncbi:MAG: nucleotide-binding protein [Magnetococcales bacterium]|nr:nucleotide-binding protein [Magnetococcales bacterium]
MAKIPIEIVMLDETYKSDIRAAIRVSNSIQNEFDYQLLSNLSKSLQLYNYKEIDPEEFLDSIERKRKEVLGYHPFIICITDQALKYNLSEAYMSTLGLAIITTSTISGIVTGREFTLCYFICCFARYAIVFLIPYQKSHEEIRECLFDRGDARNRLKSQAFCDGCKRSIADSNQISTEQFYAINLLLAKAKDIKNNGHKETKIFIASSSGALTVSERLANNLNKHTNLTASLWNDSFPLGNFTLETLEEIPTQYEYGIFILTPDDILEKKGEIRPVGRDNVLFELGLFIGRHGRKKSFIITSSSLHLPSDLNGLTIMNYTEKEIEAIKDETIEEFSIKIHKHIQSQDP